MIIRTSAKYVCYPASRQQAIVFLESARIRFVRGSLLVNTKLVETLKRSEFSSLSYQENLRRSAQKCIES